jgi:bile acid:Na+ symporter, BASS family
MSDFLASLSNVVVAVFAVTSMLSVGLSYTVRQIVDPLRNARLVILVLVANFVLVPLLTFAVMGILSLDRSLEIGLILLATAAGAPFLVLLVRSADGDMALSAGLLVLLLVVTIFYMPLVVPLALPGVTVSAGAIAGSLFTTMLLPLVIGLVVEAIAPARAEGLRPVIGQVSQILLVMLVIVISLANLREILGVFGTGAILAALLVIGGAFVVGYAIGGPDRDARVVTGLGTAQRNIAAAMVVATQDLADPDVTVMVVVSSLVGLALLFPVAWALRAKKRAGA